MVRLTKVLELVIKVNIITIVKIVNVNIVNENYYISIKYYLILIFFFISLFLSLILSSLFILVFYCFSPRIVDLNLCFVFLPFHSNFIDCFSTNIFCYLNRASAMSPVTVHHISYLLILVYSYISH